MIPIRYTKKNMIKNILITGGAGYIGSHIAEILINKKKNIFILDNLSTGHKKLIQKKARFFLADIRSSKQIKKILKKKPLFLRLRVSLAIIIKINNLLK